MKVIVTGGAGFIGKALVSYLRKCDIAVCIVDRKIGIEAKTFFRRLIFPMLIAFTILLRRHRFSTRIWNKSVSITLKRLW